MSLWSRRQAGFIIMEDGGTDGSGTNAGDKIIYDGDGAGVASDAEHFMTYQDSVSDEEKPKFLNEAADGSGDAANAATNQSTYRKFCPEGFEFPGPTESSSSRKRRTRWSTSVAVPEWPR